MIDKETIPENEKKGIGHYFRKFLSTIDNILIIVGLVVFVIAIGELATLDKKYKEVMRKIDSNQKAVEEKLEKMQMEQKNTQLLLQEFLKHNKKDQ